MSFPRKPSLAVWKFASCDGCQLTLLDCEDELLTLAGEVELSYFLEAGRATPAGPYDLSLVEGSITTSADAARIREVRAASKRLVTIGACATAGGIQALRNFGDVEEFLAIVYAQPQFISTLADSTPIAAHVPVDFELRGCPITKTQLLEVIGAFLHGRRPSISPHSVCVECKTAGNVCVTVAHGTPCLGPVTQAGCAALCPSYNRGCYGCFGPMETPNLPSMVQALRDQGVDDDGVVRLLRTFNAGSPPFREAADEIAARAQRTAPMTHRSPASRTLKVDAITRVEGEGAMYIEIHDGTVRDVQLRIYEPPRFFEAFLRGRRFTEPPDITARICGICPVAYQMSACNAIEAACGVDVDGPLHELRRLLYCGEWIESHALHVYLLHAPDFLGYESAIDLAADHAAVVERGLQLKKVGNEILELIGGRAIHPVNVRVGGFYRVPTRRELEPLRERLLVALDAALETVHWVSGFDFPDFTHELELVALRSPDRYAVLGGRLVSTHGLEIAADDFDAHIVEEHVAHSTALHAHLLERGEYLVGPLARYALNSSQLAPEAHDAAAAAGLSPEERNPFRSIVVRVVEIVHAAAEALRIIDAYVQPDRPAVAVEPRAGVGCGWTEAPRGMLWHRYELAADGTIIDARIVPPTSQNQPAIEHDLFHFVEANAALDDDTLRHRCEQVIRNYDPCISCATHFLDMRVERT